MAYDWSGENPHKVPYPLERRPFTYLDFEYTIFHQQLIATFAKNL